MNKLEFKILLIDDDQDDFFIIRDLFGDILNERYKITWKSNYIDGLNCLKENHFDACLLDYRLGEKSGIDLLLEVQNLHIKTPIILLTGQSDFDLDVKAMQTGAFEYLVKGNLNSILLERTVRYAMKHALDMEDLNDQKELFKALFNSTFEGILVHKNLIIADINAALCEIFDYTTEEMIGKSFLDFIHPDFKENVAQKVSSERMGAFETIGIKKNNLEMTLEILNRTVHHHHYNISIVAIRDITNRKMMETQILQQDRLASLGLLASSLAHEIGTPLGIIRSRSEMIEKKYHDIQLLSQDMNSIISQIDKITKLVNSLLHLARERKSSFSGMSSLNQVVDDVCNLVQHELHRKNINFIKKIPSDVFVKAESASLGQVFLNLLVNATQAIEEAIKSGNINNHQISILAEVLSSTVEIEISDTGCGIPEKNLQHIFKPFFTTKEIGSGTGLGLAISYKLMQSWGGSIQVKNSNLRGSTFKLTLNKAN